jgi:hypothetical protein
MYLTYTSNIIDLISICLFILCIISIFISFVIIIGNSSKNIQSKLGEWVDLE